jgi:hypothetical protein
MIKETAVRSGIALVAGAVVAWSLAVYGLDALATPETSVAVVLLALFGSHWLR